LESELSALGSNALGGISLQRISKGKYKLGDSKILVKATNGKIGVRLGGGCVPLLDFLKEKFPENFAEDNPQHTETAEPEEEEAEVDFGAMGNAYGNI